MLDLLMVIAVIGIITITATPLFLSFVQAQQTRGAANQLATLLNQARQLAITRNQNICVEPSLTQVRFCPGGCALGICNGAPFTGPGTDANGWMRLENQAVITGVPVNPVTFNSLGTAGGGTITVRNAQGSSTLDVVVAPSGRIRIQ